MHRSKWQLWGLALRCPTLPLTLEDFLRLDKEEIIDAIIEWWKQFQRGKAQETSKVKRPMRPPRGPPCSLVWRSTLEVFQRLPGSKMATSSKVVRLLRQLLKVDRTGHHELLTLELVMVLMCLGRWQEADAVLKQHMSEKPLKENPFAHFLSGLVSLYQSDFVRDEGDGKDRHSTPVSPSSSSSSDSADSNFDSDSDSNVYKKQKVSSQSNRRSSSHLARAIASFKEAFRRLPQSDLFCYFLVESLTGMSSKPRRDLKNIEEAHSILVRFCNTVSDNPNGWSMLYQLYEFCPDMLKWKNSTITQIQCLQKWLYADPLASIPFLKLIHASICGNLDVSTGIEIIIHRIDLIAGKVKKSSTVEMKRLFQLLLDFLSRKRKEKRNVNFNPLQSRSWWKSCFNPDVKKTREFIQVSKEFI
eukprot:g140.t1